MIELNNKTQHDFLNRKWVKKLLDAGVDMSDAKYYICCLRYGSINKGPNIQVALKEELPWIEGMPGCLPALEYNWSCPTYTISELLYKLHEWICPTIDGKQFSGELKFIKDAPFYIFYYDLKTKDYNPLKFSHDQLEEWSEDFVTEFETPIESLAALLIQCHQKDIGMKYKDTGDIRDKYERH